MKYETQHKDSKIIVQPAEDEDWKGDSGYEAKVTPRGCKTATTWSNYPNASQALLVAKEAIDSGEVPRERQKFLGLF